MIRRIEKLLAGRTIGELREGLALVKAEIERVGPGEAGPLFEVLSSIFFIDPLDRPDLGPILSEAVSLVAGFGKWVVPALIQKIEIEDMKAQFVCAQALGAIGVHALDDIIHKYETTSDLEVKSFLLYAMGKIKSPKILRAAPLAIEAARSSNHEFRDTGTRAIGKFAESIPSGELPDEIRRQFVETLQKNAVDLNVSIRSKAIRSLGKLAKFKHLTAEEKDRLRGLCNTILGKDEQFEWDRAYIVRREAEEAIQYL